MDRDEKSQNSRSALFESRDPTEIYKGSDRRQGHRRSYQDRREEMRFEMDKPDRRTAAGRRGDEKKPSFW